MRVRVCIMYMCVRMFSYHRIDLCTISNGWHSEWSACVCVCARVFVCVYEIEKKKWHNGIALYMWTCCITRAHVLICGVLFFFPALAHRHHSLVIIWKHCYAVVIFYFVFFLDQLCRYYWYSHWVRLNCQMLRENGWAWWWLIKNRFEESFFLWFLSHF